jgi:glycosyltransferase involved in cell wall biosynthesis
MATILVHALGATAGGGATYLRHFLDILARSETPHRWIVLVSGAASFPEPVGPARDRIDLRVFEPGSIKGAVRRTWFDQVGLRSLIAKEKVDLIVATGNFGMLRPPVPQILLNRNPLYFSAEHVRQLSARGDYRELLTILLRRRLAIASIRASELNVVPTSAFGDMIRESAPQASFRPFRTIYHGFDRSKFTKSSELSPAIAGKLRGEPGLRRLLMVSHYNYFRNFETVIRGFAELLKTAREPLELVLTTTLGEGVRDHRYDTTRCYRLAKSLGVLDRITMLGTVPYPDLHPLYLASDVAICPAYAESFGHPMVEAMASGRPIVASDCGVQREMCGPAALYFPAFDGAALADRARQLLDDPALSGRLANEGRRRANDFSWDRHFRELLTAIDDTLGGRVGEPVGAAVAAGTLAAG